MKDAALIIKIMPQLLIPYRALKKLLAIAAILLGAGILYVLYSDLNLFLQGNKISGVITKLETYHQLGRSDVYITYNFDDRPFVGVKTKIVDGLYGYSTGQKVAVYVDPKSPTTFTISRENTHTIFSFFVDHSFYIFPLLIICLFLAYGFSTLFKIGKQINKINQP